MKAINVLLAILVSAAIGLLVFEGGLRFIGMGPVDTGLRFDPKTGWALKPDHRFENHGPEFDVVIETDAHGLRDDYHTEDVKKPEGVFRVVCLGDSFTLGYTCDREDLFVDLLETWWQAEGRKIEVVNAGVQAYSTDQQVRWLEENVDLFEPDLVVVFPYENDLFWNTKGSYAGNSKPLYDDRGELQTTDDLEDTVERSFIQDHTAIGYKWLRSRPATPLYTLPGSGKKIAFEHTPLLVDAPPAVLGMHRRLQGILTRARAVSIKHGFQLAVCPIPSHSQVDEEYAANEMGPRRLGLEREGWNPDRPYGILTEAANSAGAKVLSPLEALEAAEKKEPQYREVDWHLSPAGNRTLASYLHDELDQQALVPAREKMVTLAEVASIQERKSGGLPGWLPWFAGLWLLLGTLYSRTYQDESAVASYAKVGGLLAVIFTIAVGGTGLIGLLHPKIATIVLLSVILLILGFVAYKLGDRIGTAAELLKAFTLRGHWYLMPLLTILVTVGSLLVVAASSPLVAPFIYTLF